MDQPSVTPQQLLEALTKANVITHERIVTLLGEQRHTVTLNQLELALVGDGVITAVRLAQLKGAISGRQVFDPTDHKINAGILPGEFVRHAGAFVVDRDPLTIAMVEDLPSTIEVIAEAVGTTDFEIWFFSAAQFDGLYKTYYEGNSDEANLQNTADIFEILDEAVRRRASDIHLSAANPPVLRVDGKLVAMQRAALTEDWLVGEFTKLSSPAKMDLWRTHGDADFAYAYGQSRFRVNIGKDRRGLTAALRKIPTIIPSMDDLGLPQSVRNLTELERGLVLVVGPTGSGKSTTLASMLGHVARFQAEHIITLEDPIEFLLPEGRSIVHQRELGQSFTSFPAGLRQALRQDPDIVLVGEMRDPETIKTAMTAAETGHLVFATLHTFDSASTVARIVSSFPPEEQDQIRAQLAYILKAVVAQSLLPLANSKGRVAAIEVLLSTPAIQNNLRKVDGHNQLRQTIETATKDGMQTMEMALASLVKRGLVSQEVAEHRASDRESFRRRMDSGDF